MVYLNHTNACNKQIEGAQWVHEVVGETIRGQNS